MALPRPWEFGVGSGIFPGLIPGNGNRCGVVCGMGGGGGGRGNMVRYYVRTIRGLYYCAPSVTDLPVGFVDAFHYAIIIKILSAVFSFVSAHVDQCAASVLFRLLCVDSSLTT